MKIDKLRLGIWGWWGQKNLGDNWILSTMQEMFRKYEIIPLSDTTLDFSPYNLDFVILGGGGLFAERVKPPWNSPQSIKIPYGVFSLGTEHGVDKTEIRNLKEKAIFFSVRDAMTAKKFGFAPNEVDIIPDATFYKPIRSTSCIDGHISLIWRNDLRTLHRYSSTWTEYVGGLTAKEDWIAELKKVAPNIKIKDVDFYTEKTSPYTDLRGSIMIISMRYHGVIAAVQMGVPCIAIDVCPKIKALMEALKLEDLAIKVGDLHKLEKIYALCTDESVSSIKKMRYFTERAKYSMFRYLRDVAYPCLNNLVRKVKIK